MGLKKKIHKSIKEKENVLRRQRLEQEAIAKEKFELAESFIEQRMTGTARKFIRESVVADIKAKQLKAELKQSPKLLKYLTAPREAKKRLKRLKKRGKKNA